MIKFFISILLLDEKVTASVSGEYDVFSENTNCESGPTIQPITHSNSCLSKDKHSTIAPQQEDNGRSGGSGGNVNNTSDVKGSGRAWIITQARTC